MVGSLEVEAHEVEQGGEESLGLAQRKVEEDTKGERELDHRVRELLLTPTTTIGKGRPGLHKHRRKPDGDLTALAQRSVVGGPVDHAIPGLVSRMHLRSGRAHLFLRAGGPYHTFSGCCTNAVGRYARLDLLVLDELGYLPLSKADAELLFQVLSERAEQCALVLTTNLKFSEWTSIFPDARLCRAVIDRLTHRSHIVDTGKDSIRLEEALERQGRAGAEATA